MLEILVVDDEEDICWALEQGLREEGVHITQVTLGEDAIREVRERAFDVAIIDVKLPGKSGIETSQVIRQIDPRLKILMISGYHYEDDQPIQEGIQRGQYHGFISKPFDLDEVSSLVGKVMMKS